jgi:hypothetical protein
MEEAVNNAPENLNEWVVLINNICVFIAGLVAAIWAYSKFIVERGLIPSAQFDIELGTVGAQQKKLVLEILLHLKNIGTSTLIIKNFRIDILYIDKNDEPALYGIGDKQIGKLYFERKAFEKTKPKEASNSEDNVQISSDKQLRKDRHTKGKNDRGIPIVKHNTFVQPGVDQTYTFGTAVPISTTYILVWSSFEYEPRPSLLQRPILWLSRVLGLIQYSLRHIDQPHTCERIFRVFNPEVTQNINSLNPTPQ